MKDNSAPRVPTGSSKPALSRTQSDGAVRSATGGTSPAQVAQATERRLKEQPATDKPKLQIQLNDVPQDVPASATPRPSPRLQEEYSPTGPLRSDAPQLARARSAPNAGSAVAVSQPAAQGEFFIVPGGGPRSAATKELPTGSERIHNINRPIDQVFANQDVIDLIRRDGAEIPGQPGSKWVVLDSIDWRRADGTTAGQVDLVANYDAQSNELRVWSVPLHPEGELQPKYGIRLSTDRTQVKSIIAYSVRKDTVEPADFLARMVDRDRLLHEDFVGSLLQR